MIGIGEQKYVDYEDTNICAGNEVEFSSEQNFPIALKADL